MNTELLIAKLESARSAIAKAEADLETAIGEVRVAPRAEKVQISEVLEDAFGKLRGAKDELADIEAMLTEDDT